MPPCSTLNETDDDEPLIFRANFESISTFLWYLISFICFKNQFSSNCYSNDSTMCPNSFAKGSYDGVPKGKCFPQEFQTYFVLFSIVISIYIGNFQEVGIVWIPFHDEMYCNRAIMA